MQTNRSLIWLSSYPKSGNTWLRAFLGNYFFNHDGPMPLAMLKQISSGDSSGTHYSEITKKPAEKLTTAEQMQARQVVLSRIAGQAPMSLIKTHNANRMEAALPLIPEALTQLALYVIRDPRDVVISYADHFGLSFEDAAQALNDSSNGTPAGQKIVAQFMDSWSGHVRSWVDATDINVCTIRYEDMTADPETAFAKIVKSMGAPLDKATLKRAIKYASFDSLSKMEAKGGFEERSGAQERFFRKGRAGQWRDTLPEPIAARILADHGEVMARFGYD